jgi:hypothetical protein
MSAVGRLAATGSYAVLYLYSAEIFPTKATEIRTWHNYLYGHCSKGDQATF